MSEKELGEALLRLDATELSGIPEARQHTWKVLERDRRRVRLLTGLTIFIWILAAVLIMAGLVAYALTFPKQALLITQIEAGAVTEAQRDEIQRSVLVEFQKGTLLIAFSVAVMAMAALCTVLLILASRRATLRQVNASLVELGNQLRQLRQTPFGQTQETRGVT